MRISEPALLFQTITPNKWGVNDYVQANRNQMLFGSSALNSLSELQVKWPHAFLWKHILFMIMKQFKLHLVVCIFQKCDTEVI